MMLLPLAADAQAPWGPAPPAPIGNPPPYWGPTSYFEEIRVNPTGESTCFSSSATCLEAFNFSMPAGFDGATVFIADFMVRDQGLTPELVRRVAAAIRNVAYSSMSGDLAFDVTVTLDGGGPRGLEWTMAVAVLLYKASDVFVSDGISLSCSAEGGGTCEAKATEPASSIVPPGLSFVSFLPLELEWEVLGTDAILADRLEFDISTTPLISSGNAEITTQCALSGVSAVTGLPVPTRCGQVVQAFASATPLFVIPPGGVPDHEIDAEQFTYEDGLWSFLYSADPHRTDGTVPVWVKGGLTFPGNFLPFSELGGGCSNPAVLFDEGMTDALRAWYGPPWACWPVASAPCPSRINEEDIRNYDMGAGPFPFRNPLTALYCRFTAKFMGRPGSAPSVGTATCRLLDLP